MLKIDLHSHTTCSDGTLTPTELLQRAEIKHVNVLALTDHDCTDGLNEALEYLESTNSKLELVNGVEISTQWHGFEIHIVGLAIDPSNNDLMNLLKSQVDKRTLRAKAVGEKLAKKGFPNVYEEALKLANGPIISRTHFAKALIAAGVVQNFEQAFKKYLGKGKGAYVSANWTSIEEAVKVIKKAGGISVIAHPTRYDLSNKWLRRLIEQFSEAGGDAIEVGLSQINPDQKKFVSSLAKEHKLYSSLGSDFHSPTRWTELGRGITLTEECTPIWQHANWSTQKVTN
jgi:3',5'-nucleoside bisphosphate phosphatase